MKLLPRTIAIAALASGLSLSAVPSSEAARWHGRGHHGGIGRGLALGLGAAVVGSALAGSAWGYGRPGYSYYDDDDDDDGPAYYGYGDGEARCRATFRSYDPDSGTYTGYDGITRRCPYL